MNVPVPHSPTGRAALLLFRKVLAVGALAVCALLWWPSAAHAGEDPLAPMRPVFAEHKTALLELEHHLRDAPDTVLTGLPGFRVLIFACEGGGCVGAHQIRLNGRDTSLDSWLGRAFADGGMAAVAVPEQPVQVDWGVNGKWANVAVTPPPAGQVVQLTRQGKEVQVGAPFVPSASHAWRVALAERARGDVLAAAATMAAGIRVHQDRQGRYLLLLADLYREAGLANMARGAYRELLSGKDPELVARARMGLARGALDEGRPKAALEVLTRVRLPARSPLAAELNGLLIRSRIAVDPGPELVRELPPSGGEAFVAFNLALAYISVGDTFSAVNALREAASLANSSVPEEEFLKERAWLALGTLLAGQERLDDALRAFDELSPRGHFGDRYRFGRGYAFYRHGDLVKAVAEFKQLEQDWPDSPYTLEGRLIRADAYRRLNAPRQAVTEYRTALSRFQERGRRIDTLLAQSEQQPFDQGITALVFAPAGEVPPLQQGDAARGLSPLFHTDAFARMIAEYRQIRVTIDRLHGLNRRLAGKGQEQNARRVSEAVERMGVFKTLYEGAAREQVVRTLTNERRRMEELSITAALGATQSMLSDQSGGRGLTFGGGQ